MKSNLMLACCITLVISGCSNQPSPRAQAAIDRLENLPTIPSNFNDLVSAWQNDAREHTQTIWVATGDLVAATQTATRNALETHREKLLNSLLENNWSYTDASDLLDRITIKIQDDLLQYYSNIINKSIE